MDERAEILEEAGLDPDDWDWQRVHFIYMVLKKINRGGRPDG